MITTRSTDHGEALLPAYAEHADSYDQDISVHDRWRRSLVDALSLRPGDTVLDVGCGTGLCFPHLLDRIGPSGVIIGRSGSGDAGAGPGRSSTFTAGPVCT